MPAFKSLIIASVFGAANLMVAAQTMVLRLEENFNSPTSTAFSYLTTAPAWSFGSGLATANCGSQASTLGYPYFKGSKIVVEARMQGTGADYDPAFLLFDANSGEHITIGQTNYSSFGFYALATGSFGVGQAGNGSSIPGFLEYRLTLQGSTMTVERGPSLSAITETLTRTLASPIDGRSFYAVLGTNFQFCPTEYDFIRIYTSQEGPTPFNFQGFFPPVENLPAINSVNAGRTVPIKFKLGGDQGEEIFQPGYPASGQVNCTFDTPPSVLEPLATTSLVFDEAADHYLASWKTNKSWAGQCRVFVMKLIDGSTHSANFSFR